MTADSVSHELGHAQVTPRKKPRGTKAERIREELRANPMRTNIAIATQLSCGRGQVAKLRAEMGDDMVDVEGPPRTYPLKLPPGTTLSELARKGLALEEEKSIPPEKAAKEVGISTLRYREARDLILLSQQPLQPTDLKLVQHAIDIMDLTVSTLAASKLVAHLVKKTFGDGGKHRNAKAALKRLNAFRKAIAVVDQACSSAAQIDIPLLPPDEARSIAHQLEEGMQSLRRLKFRVTKGEDHA